LRKTRGKKSLEDVRNFLPAGKIVVAACRRKFLDSTLNRVRLAIHGRSDMSQENVAIVRRWFDEVWNRGQLATIHELMAADAVGIGQGGGEVAIRGPQEFQAFVEKLRGAFPDIHVTIEDAFAAGDKVAARWSATMTHRGDHLGLPASGKKVRITGISLVKIANGKIVAGWDNWDQMTMMREIGALKGAEIPLAASGS
jgi:steroid delta-isomerase-like uncharacterized protein